MYYKLLEEWKTRKKKNQKFLVFSHFNKIVNDLYFDTDIDVIRFDLEEYALLNGYKDSKRVMDTDYLRMLNNIKLPIDVMFAVDIPMNVLYSGDNIAIDKIIDFYQKSNANFIVIDLDEITDNLAKKLASLKIPIILSLKQVQENTVYYEKTKNKLKGLEESGIFMLILKDSSPSFASHIKEEILIPVINTINDKKTDGFYGIFSEIFGLVPHKKKKYLNLYELIQEAIKDCAVDVDKKM